jgi:hypothetical protein
LLWQPLLGADGHCFGAYLPVSTKLFYWMRTEPETVLVTPPPEAVTVNELFPFLALSEAVIVSIEDPVPPAIGFVLNPDVSPVFKPLTDRTTSVANPFTGETVTVKVVLPGRARVCELGERLRVKLGTGAAVTTSAVVAVCESAPLVATTESVYVPAGVPEGMVTVKLPPLAGVAVAPEGSPVTAP